MSIPVPALTEEQCNEVFSCAVQCIKQYGKPQHFFCVSVWESNIANEVLHSNCPVGSYTVSVKTGFKNAATEAEAREIWSHGCLPIEVVRREGGVFLSPLWYEIEMYLLS